MHQSITSIPDFCLQYGDYLFRVRGLAASTRKLHRHDTNQGALLIMYLHARVTSVEQRDGPKRIIVQAAGRFYSGGRDTPGRTCW